MTNMLKILMRKVNNVQDQISGVNIKMANIQINQMKMLII